jgi:hypothetical protein
MAERKATLRDFSKIETVFARDAPTFAGASHYANSIDVQMASDEFAKTGSFIARNGLAPALVVHNPDGSVEAHPPANQRDYSGACKTFAKQQTSKNMMLNRLRMKLAQRKGM